MNTVIPHHELETEVKKYRKASGGATPDELAEFLDKYHDEMEVLRAVISGEHLSLTIPEAAVAKIKRLEARVAELEAEYKHDTEVHEAYQKNIIDALQHHAVKFYNPNKRTNDNPTIYHSLGIYITELETERDDAIEQRDLWYRKLGYESFEEAMLDGSEETTAPVLPSP